MIQMLQLGFRKQLKKSVIFPTVYGFRTVVSGRVMGGQSAI